MLSFAIKRITDADKVWAFRTIKREFYDGLAKEDGFVSQVVSSLGKLDRILNKNRRDLLWKGLAIWRVRNVEQSEDETE